MSVDGDELPRSPVDEEWGEGDSKDTEGIHKSRGEKDGVIPA